MEKLNTAATPWSFSQTSDSFYLPFINNFDLNFYSFQTIFISNHPKLLSSLTFLLSLSLVYKQILILEGSLSKAGLRGGADPAPKGEHTNKGPRALLPRKPWNLDVLEHLELHLNLVSFDDSNAPDF